jgi:hypothetical protein
LVAKNQPHSGPYCEAEKYKTNAYDDKDTPPLSALEEAFKISTLLVCGSQIVEDTYGNGCAHDPAHDRTCPLCQQLMDCSSLHRFDREFAVDRILFGQFVFRTVSFAWGEIKASVRLYEAFIGLANELPFVMPWFKHSAHVLRSGHGFR